MWVEEWEWENNQKVKKKEWKKEKVRILDGDGFVTGF